MMRILGWWGSNAVSQGATIPQKSEEEVRAEEAIKAAEESRALAEAEKIKNRWLITKVVCFTSAKVCSAVAIVFSWMARAMGGATFFWKSSPFSTWQSNLVNYSAKKREESSKIFA